MKKRVEKGARGPEVGQGGSAATKERGFSREEGKGWRGRKAFNEMKRAREGTVGGQREKLKQAERDGELNDLDVQE